MILLVFIFYGLFMTYDILYLLNNSFKKEIPIYIIIMSISVIISSLVALNISIPSPMIYFESFFEWVKDILGGIL
ncbi:hypothetical protein EXM63_13155 [Clostridium botulinum]|uniref:Uncharacterized protein n=1 Tax=Clostridium botulinum TaxID=1491 RepID=A0A6M0T0I3_CLOBO|nr:hypothetical protein [Clostridium botulinum]NFI72890.1 hypothetical protein [Clostridium sporogenes]NFL73134.1 hypothetical protein [Clostridium sporogenes]NFM22931.1 hypothetical protein [Clostridium sporogenes]NFP60303.1 hypothetical protein [Clostridium sporogenes]